MIRLPESAFVLFIVSGGLWVHFCNTSRGVFGCCSFHRCTKDFSFLFLILQPVLYLVLFSVLCILHLVTCTYLNFVILALLFKETCCKLLRTSSLLYSYATDNVPIAAARQLTVQLRNKSSKKNTKDVQKAGISFTSVFDFMPENVIVQWLSVGCGAWCRKEQARKKNGLTLRRDSLSFDKVFFWSWIDKKETIIKTTGSWKAGDFDYIS